VEQVVAQVEYIEVAEPVVYTEALVEPVVYTEVLAAVALVANIQTEDYPLFG
jgi:hypothetical protein